MILFNDFKAHYAAVREAVRPAVDRVLDSAWYILGEELQAFEAAFGDYVGAQHAVGVASGTDAIALALMAAGISGGDEVITTNLTAFPTITGITMTGAVPVVVDIDPATGLMDPAQLEAGITPRARAIVPVHLYGQSCDLDPIHEIAATHRLAIIEDCAQSAGADYRGRKTGSIGTAGCFSFYPTKNLGAFGDAGAVTTNDSDVYERLLQLRNYGQTKRYYHDHNGINSRLDEMQAAILNVKLPLLDGWNARRRDIAAQYRQSLPEQCLLVERDYGRSVYHLFPIQVPNRDAFTARMTELGVQTLIHYPVTIQRQKAFKGQQSDAFPVSNSFADQIVSIPIYPELIDAQVDKICRAVNAVLGQDVD